MTKSRTVSPPFTSEERALLEDSLGASAAAAPEGRRGPRRSFLLSDESTLVPFLIGAFRSGLFRRVGGPEGERIAFDVFRRTTVGQVMFKLLDSTNRSLLPLRGRVIQEVTCSIPSYGVFQVGIRTDFGPVLLEVDEGGARLIRGDQAP